MTIKAYSFVEKKKVAIVSNIKLQKKALPNGNVVTIATGLSKKGNKVAVLMENTKPKPCKKPLGRGKNAGCVSKKSPNKLAKAKPKAKK
jgi:hypothetical protein